MARNAFQTPRFSTLIFFFARQNRPSIKQVIFQKHCFNGTNHHNNLHIVLESYET